MYVLYPFLSQEIGNAKFIENHRIGKVVWKKSTDDAQDILNLLKSPSCLEKMRENMQKIKDELEILNVMDVYEKGA